MPVRSHNYRTNLSISTIFTKDDEVTQTASDLSLVLKKNDIPIAYTESRVTRTVVGNNVPWSFNGLDDDLAYGTGTYTYTITATPQKQVAGYGNFSRAGTFNIADAPEFRETTITETSPPTALSKSTFSVQVDPRGAEILVDELGETDIYVVSIATPAAPTDDDLGSTILVAKCQLVSGVYVATFTYKFVVDSAILIVSTDVGSTVAIRNSGVLVPVKKGSASLIAGAPPLLAEFIPTA